MTHPVPCQWKYDIEPRVNGNMSSSPKKFHLATWRAKEFEEFRD